MPAAIAVLQRCGAFARATQAALIEFKCNIKWVTNGQSDSGWEQNPSWVGVIHNFMSGSHHHVAYTYVFNQESLNDNLKEDTESCTIYPFISFSVSDGT